MATFIEANGKLVRIPDDVRAKGAKAVGAFLKGKGAKPSDDGKEND